MSFPPRGSRTEGREGELHPDPSRPGRMRWLALVLLLPGGLLLALGLGIAWAGLVLLIPGLRRLTTALAGTSVAPGLTCHRDSKPAQQPHGESHEPSPPIVWIGTRTPWASYGDHATSTGRDWGGN